MDLSKTIIRIIEDYCSENCAIYLMDRFATTLAPRIIELQRSNTFANVSLYQEVKKRKDFCIANDLNDRSFAYGLYKRLKSELTLFQPETLLDVLKRFKRKMENGAFRGFPKETTSEDTLRCTLVLFLEEDTFMEARAAAGQSDICIPSLKTVIETKLWEGVEYFNSGIPEVTEYIEKYGYSNGYYVVFDYNRSENEIEKNQGHVFDMTYNGYCIHVILIRMNAIRPSKKYANQFKPKPQ